MLLKSTTFPLWLDNIWINPWCVGLWTTVLDSIGAWMSRKYSRVEIGIRTGFMSGSAIEGKFNRFGVVKRTVGRGQFFDSCSQTVDSIHIYGATLFTRMRWLNVLNNYTFCEFYTIAPAHFLEYRVCRASIWKKRG